MSVFRCVVSNCSNSSNNNSCCSDCLWVVLVKIFRVKV